MKATKLYGFGPRKSKGGFTLIELLIVMVILAILAGVVVMAVGGVFGTTKDRAYQVTKDELKNAVAQYASDHAGDLPYLNESVATINSSGTTADIIDVGELLIAQNGLLAQVPDSCTEIASGNNDNCDGTNGGTCNTEAHYVWGMDDAGSIYSVCIGCTGWVNTDGYADNVYP
jgi:prepilin-type N-terminal cleavage/methylation domain-containing protein